MEFVGQALARFEDRRFLTGTGAYGADLNLPGQARALMLRSPHAHAEIGSIDISAALAAPDVLAVYTGEDLRAAGFKVINSMTRTAPFAIPNRDGSGFPEGSQFPLAIDRVRYVGEPVALVVAESDAAARDALDLIEVDYRELGAVVTVEAALAQDAPPLWAEADHNRSVDWETGDRAAAAAAFSTAAHVVEVEVAYPRCITAFMEPRSALASYDEAEDRFLLQAGCQSAHRLRDSLAEAFDLPPDRFRVVVPDVGGGFGARIQAYPEFIAALFAARALGRPVKWVADRSEALLCDSHARSQSLKLGLALDEAGRFLAIRAETLWCHGAYIVPRSVYVLANAMPGVGCGPYRIGAFHFSLRGVFTSSTPIASYRGVGRAEMAFGIERLVEKAARTLGFDPVELRRRNLIAPGEMPWHSPTGAVYGPALLPRNLDLGLEAIDWSGFESRKTESASRGRLRGRGLALYIMSAGGVPEENADLHLFGSGEIVARVGTQDFGMGHQTTFSQLLADRLGVEPTAVRILDGDSDAIAKGAGAHGSRSLRTGGNAIGAAAEAVIDQGRALAAKMWEAAVEDVVFEDAGFILPGRNRHIGLTELALEAERRAQPLRAFKTYQTEGACYPNGCHLCEVEVDPDTGAVSIERLVTVADPGRVINPLIVEGQMRGGLVQGVGEALMEAIRYDPDSGQLMTGSFLDYALPRADDVPMIATRLNPVENPDNPLGVKGIGEAGNTGAPAAVVNAVLDAVAKLGVTELDMPLTPERVWRALSEASINTPRH